MACEEGVSDGLRLDSGDSTMWLEPDPTTQKVGQLFGMKIELCDGEGSVKQVNATMPAHGHGMNYRPKVSQVTPGLFEAQGLLFHMPGSWQLSIEVLNNGEKTVFQKDVMILP